MEKTGWLVVVTTLITVGGTIAVAVINHTPAKVDDKGSGPQPAPTPNPVPVPAPAPAVDPAPVPQPAVEPVEPKPKARPVPIQIGGTWVDPSGLNMTIDQSGVGFRMNASFGTAQVYAQGTILGRELRWTYTNTANNPGQCVGMLQAGDERIDAQCQQMSGPPYTMQLARAG